MKQGCIFVIELKNQRGKRYYTKVFRAVAGRNGKPLSVINKKDGLVISLVSTLDGATIISKNGSLVEFGVTLRKERTFLGHGKRHAFALGTSRIKDVVCILGSEEDKHVRMFRDGVCVVDMDARTKVPANLRHRVIDVLDTPLSKILVASGIATSVLTLNPIPAIITITGSSVIVSYGFDRIKKFFRR